MFASDKPASRKWIAAAMLVALAAPAHAGWRLDYAPEVNLERLDVALIGRATRSIDMAAYVLTDVPVIDALAAAATRGVKVRVLFEPESREATGRVAEALAGLAASPGVEERRNRRSALMHLKSYTIDGTVLRGGAANFSASGLKQQDNDRFETDDAEAVRSFQTAFEKAWSR